MIRFFKYKGRQGNNYRDLKIGDSIWLNGKEKQVTSIKNLPDAIVIGAMGRKIKFSLLEPDFPIQLADDSLPVITRNTSRLISLEDLSKNYDYDGVVKLLHEVFLRTVEVKEESPEFIEFIKDLDPYKLWGAGIENQIYEKTGIKRIN